MMVLFLLCRSDHPGTLPGHRHEAPEWYLPGGALQPADGPQWSDWAFWNWRSNLQRLQGSTNFLLLQSSRSSWRGSQAPCTTLSHLSSWRFGSLPQTHVSLANHPLLLTGQPPSPPGLWTLAAAGAHPTAWQRLLQDSARVPAHEAHAGPESNHGDAAEIPTMPHRPQAVGHVGTGLKHRQLFLSIFTHFIFVFLGWLLSVRRNWLIT